MQWYEPILKELLVFLKAPVENTQILWVSIPLLITILVMTFYFGLYKKEELGWNTSIGNSIVLLFVCVDLLRMIYNYTQPPELINLFENPWKSVIIIAILIEAIIMVLCAFYHILPAKIMYFIASPLPVNLQAYIITTVVYLKMTPTKFTFFAAVIWFTGLFLFINLIKVFESVYVNHRHKKMSEEVKELMYESRALLKEAKKASKIRRITLIKRAKEKNVEAKIVANKLATAEEMQHGELIFAKKLLRLDKKSFMF